MSFEPERKALALAPLGQQPGRLRGQVGVEDGMYTCSISVGSRRARKLESRKFLKLYRQPLILFEFMIFCICELARHQSMRLER